MDRNKCSLFPYEREDIFSIQEAKQKSGWNVTAFHIPDTWLFSQGENTTVAVIDTGCDLDHPDLDANLVPGFNFCNPKKPPHDGNGHGTHCCGIIAAENNDLGVVGVAPHAKIMPIKALDDKGNGNLINAALAVRWAVDHGADIISMSLGAPCKVQNVRKAIQYAASKGVPVFVSAGNMGVSREVFYPAAYPETIAIGSIDENFKRSEFSMTGENLDFMAPGGKILSTVPDNWYAVLSGTSQACPWAAGVAALVLSYVKRHPDCKIELKNVDNYRNVFRDHTISVSDKEYGGKKFFQGFGIIDPKSFVEWAKNK